MTRVSTRAEGRFDALTAGLPAGGDSSAATAAFFESAAVGLALGFAGVPFLGIWRRIILRGDVSNEK
jgi:hypothetical protein